MKISVTGGAGYVESVTVEVLLDDGYRVLVLDNLRQGHKGTPRTQVSAEVKILGDKTMGKR